MTSKKNELEIAKLQNSVKELRELVEKRDVIIMQELAIDRKSIMLLMEKVADMSNSDVAPKASKRNNAAASVSETAPPETQPPTGTTVTAPAEVKPRSVAWTVWVGKHVKGNGSLEIFEAVLNPEEAKTMHSCGNDQKKKIAYITETIKANPTYLKNLRQLIAQADAKNECVAKPPVEEPVATSSLSERYPPFVEEALTKLLEDTLSDEESDSDVEKSEEEDEEES